MHLKAGHAKFLVCIAPNETSRTALRLACRKAKLRGGEVDILYVQEPLGFQPLRMISTVFVQEQEKKAQDVLTLFARQAYEESGVQAQVTTRRGKLGEQILATIHEDPAITLLVLGLSPESVEGDRLVKWLAERMGKKLRIPMLVVPGNLSDPELDALV